MIHVGVVDDQELIRQGISMILDAEPDLTVTFEGADGQDLIDAVVAGRKMDVVLVDLRMPRVDGVTATAAVAQMPDPPAIVILTTFEDDESVVAALRAGAAGFLLKRSSRVQLSAAVRSAAEGDAILSPSVTRQMIQLITQDQPPVRPPKGAPDVSLLTTREMEVLRCIGRGLNNAEIAQTLFLSESTVKTHVGNVLAKTHSRDRVHTALLAARAGLA